MKFVNLDPADAFTKAIKASSKDNKLVVCGTDEDRSYIEEHLLDSPQSPKDIIRSAAKVKVDLWLKEKRLELEAQEAINLSEISGEWKSESTDKQGFNLATDFVTGEAVDNLIGVKIKTDSSWKIPAHFKFGGWNHCPSPDVHCAIWKHWQLKYGAKIVGVSNDVIEAYITKPPKTQEEAMALAWEQYLYCPDIVEQGVETVAKLAEVLINHDCWYFWWD